MKEIWKTLKAEEFIRCHDIINQENRLAIRYLASAGIPLSLINILTQTVFSYRLYLPQRSFWLLFYFVLLWLFERFAMPGDAKNATPLIYLVEIPPMLAAILLGTVWDPDHQAVTFLMFILSMPVFILDRPIRVFAISTAWTALFSILCCASKDSDLIRADIYHALEFYMASIAVSFVVLRVRLISLQSRELEQYHVEHDDLTDTRNRRSLEKRMDLYLNRQLVTVLADLDQLTLYNDFYGHSTGDEILVSFTRIVKDVFGQEHCYRFGGDEVFCIMINATEQDCMDKLQLCREKIQKMTFSGNAIGATCSFGYVIGKPGSRKQFNEMAQLAEIYVHQANKQGRDRIQGGIFDEEHLRQGIVASNLATHANAFEINQLTGLPSMSYFLARTDDLMKTVADRSRNPSIGFINLLHFRDFNDAYGYAQGDELICYIAKLLQESFPSRHVCYITGSQFGLLCYADEVERGMAQLCKGLEAYRKGVSLIIKAGFATYTGSEQTVSLMDKAKVAHNSIYQDWGVSYRFYDSSLDAENRFCQYLVKHVDEAVEKGWLKVYYQPIVRTITGKVCNEEALSRWEDPVYGFLSPYRFIPTLEENRVIYKVTLHVVRQVLHDFDTRKQQGVPIVPVSVNLSRYDFEQCDMVEEITRLVDASGYSRNMLKIEVTESAFVQNQEMLSRAIQRFRERGFEVWMDDFGSEYSTLNLLQELDFDLIKIDMKFMRHFSERGKNRIIVTDVVDMAKKMGITTLVEGVETVEQYCALKKIGCEKIQGFLFNKPNDYNYIANRAITGTGLTFERGEEAPYYQEIGRIDLDVPFTSGDPNSGFRVSRELADGILEYRQGGLSCVRGTEYFSQLLLDTGMRAPGEDASELSYPLTMTAELKRTVEHCKREPDWLSFPIAGKGHQSYVFYLRRIAENQNDGRIALLAVMIPANTN